MESWNLERLEQNVLSAADEGMRMAVGVATLGFGLPPEAARQSVAPLIDFTPVMEEVAPWEPVSPEPLVWPAPQYPQSSLGSIALGADGMVHAEDSQFAIAA